MNDPHVQYLEYHIEHSASVNYDKAPKAEYDYDGFRIIVDKKKVRFWPIDHFADLASVRAIVDPIAAAWEVEVSLSRAVDHWKLIFDDASVIDRLPTPGNIVITVPTAHLKITGNPVGLVVGANYPVPPPNISVDPDVRVMMDRFAGFKYSREPLASMAFFCLTVLESGMYSPGGKDLRSKAAARFGIEFTVLDRLGALVSKRGGLGARKIVGVNTPYTPKEESWIEEATKMLIHRRAEYAAAPAAAHRLLTMTDLPPL